MLAFIFDSVGFGEWFILLAVVLIVVGPKKLPATARSIGNYYARFRRAAEGFKRQLMDMEAEIDKEAADATKELTGAFESEGDEATVSPDEFGRPLPPEEEEDGESEASHDEKASHDEEAAHDEVAAQDATAAGGAAKQDFDDGNGTDAEYSADGENAQDGGSGDDADKRS